MTELDAEREKRKVLEHALRKIQADTAESASSFAYRMHLRATKALNDAEEIGSDGSSTRHVDHS